MKKTIAVFEELPIEVGKTYKTKFSTGEEFTVEKIIRTPGSGKILYFEGLYESSKHLGTCPIGADRLISEKVAVGTMDVCSNCGEIL
jgi:hypothetical protein